MKKDVYIHSIRTAVPPHRLAQEQIQTFMSRRLDMTPEQAAFLDKIYSGSAIEHRHSVLPDYGFEAPHQDAFLQSAGESRPGTKARNKIYGDAAPALALACGASVLGIRAPALPPSPSFAYPGDGLQALPGPSAGTLASHLRPQDITHLVTFSCTGFTAPGFDLTLQKALGLPGTTQRHHLGFMGCYGSFPALRLAQSFCLSHPGAKVLVVGVELCTLHFQDSLTTDDLVAGALFSDGAYALLVSDDPRDSDQGRPLYALKGFSTSLIPQSEERMAWEIGDFGFEMKLSAYVPRLIEGHLPDVAQDLQKVWNLDPREVKYWALHPGGRAILDKVQSRLQLQADQIQTSYDILRDYGNMSAATYGFLLAALASGNRPGGSVIGAAFGPGLTVEAGYFELHPQGKPRRSGNWPRLGGKVPPTTKWKVRAGILSPNLPWINPDTKVRWSVEELMDKPEVHTPALWKTVQQFTSLNHLLSSYKGLLIKEVLEKMTDPSRTYTLADVGAGGGDIAKWLAREARRRGLKLEITGFEPDERILPWAQERCQGIPNLKFVKARAEDLNNLGPWDFVFCNHVLHHLDNPTLEKFLREASQARVNVVLSDLRRSRLAYWGYSLISRILFAPSLAQYDGRLSILRSFQIPELHRQLLSWGLEEKLAVRKKAPFRLAVVKTSNS